MIVWRGDGGRNSVIVWRDDGGRSGGMTGRSGVIVWGRGEEWSDCVEG